MTHPKLVGNVSAMKAIGTHEAKTHLSRYLAEVEKGARFTIVRGKTVVAMLVPAEPLKQRSRPKVGRIKGEPFEFPSPAFAPLSPEELKESLLGASRVW